MQPTKLHRLLLVISGLVALAIGALLVLDPVAFHATNAIDLGGNVDLLSEVRAPGGALIASGLLMIVGAGATRLALPASLLGAVVYLGYGFARVVGLVVDGTPSSGLVTAMVIELVLGGMLTATVARAERRGCEGLLAKRGAGGEVQGDGQGDGQVAGEA